MKADSFAARIQSNIGNVEAGSCFALCQSRGARGSPVRTIFIVGTVAGMFASIVSVIVFMTKN